MSLADAEMVFSAYWMEHHVTAGAYIEQLFNFLSALKEVSPYFRSPLLVTKMAGLEPVPPTLEAFRTVMLPQLQKDDTWYVLPDGTRRKTISLDASCSTMGFYREFLFDEGSWAITLSVLGGLSARARREDWQIAADTPNSLVIECPSKELDDSDLVRRLFLQVIEHWRPAVGWVATRAFRRAVEGDIKIPIGWFTYIRDGEITKFLPSDVKWEQVSAGGALLRLGDENPSADNALAVDRSSRIREIIREHLGDPLARESALVAEGDAEFRMKVTGSPEGVVYAVKAPTSTGKVEFHGYDPARNVLLYAKRFDNFPLGPTREEVLDEARTQVRALRNDTPIEWHVATKEKADLIKELLQTDEELHEITVVHPPKFLGPTS